MVTSNIQAGDTANIVSIANNALVSMNEERSKEREGKKSFWASDCQKNVFDIYHAFIGTEPTNPFTPHALWRFKCGEYAEKGLIDALRHAGVVKMADEDQMRVELEWEGIKITGYADIVLNDKEESIVEVKSFYGSWQEKELSQGKVKQNYLMQLAVYMFFKEHRYGLLYMVPMPAGTHYQFRLEQYMPGRFRCNDVEFDIRHEFARWKRLYNNNIVPKIEPKSEYVYKKPIKDINWSRVSSGDISKARNGHKVIGDWQVQYSQYKDLIIEREGTEPGYTLDEIQLIKSLTKGYSKW